MEKIEKKEIFKILIKEFYEENISKVIERDLKIPLNTNKIITVFGPRRSGKSFYFYGIIKKFLQKKIAKNRILYINFEDDRLLPIDFKELNSLIEAYYELYPENKKKEIFLFFDEIQNVENWEIFVRRIHDKENVKIFITGSSSKLLSKEIATGLRGRTISFPLYPLNFREFLRFKGEEPEKHFKYTSQRYKIIKLLDEYLEFGGFPEIVLEKEIVIKNSILKEYFDLLVYRDLLERFSLKNSELLKDILQYLFTNITSLFSVNNYYKSVKQNMAVSKETIYDYLNFIKQTGYFALIPKFSYSLKEQKVNLHKIVAIDNGLRNRIAHVFSKDTGKLAENLVGNMLLRDKENLYYWSEKKEVDFVTNLKGIINVVNVSFGPVINKREIDSFKEFLSRYTKVEKCILITSNIEKEEKGIKMMPLYQWLLEIS